MAGLDSSCNITVLELGVAMGFSLHVSFRSKYGVQSRATKDRGYLIPNRLSAS